jgi:deoxycytidylate deaminase
VCVHAEVNALSTAARFGIALEGATIYSTLQPCFSCSRELIQVRIVRAVYLEPFDVKGEGEKDYRRLQECLGSERFFFWSLSRRT